MNNICSTREAGHNRTASYSVKEFATSEIPSMRSFDRTRVDDYRVEALRNGSVHNLFRPPLRNVVAERSSLEVEGKSFVGRRRRLLRDPDRRDAADMEESLDIELPARDYDIARPAFVNWLKCLRGRISHRGRGMDDDFLAAHGPAYRLKIGDVAEDVSDPVPVQGAQV
jgi:hypothetical protein